MKKTFAALALIVMMTLGFAGAAVAARPTTGGQPNQSCEDIPVTPGAAVNAPGSPFNPEGQAGTVYAGEQPQNSKNPHSVSQYDVACFQQSQHSTAG